MPDAIEFRTFRVETRVSGEGSAARINGYAAVYNSDSEEMGFFDRFIERISPGAFDAVLTDDVRGLVNHDPNYVLGRTKSGTLRLSADSKGLHSEITPPDTQWARDLVVSMKRGDIDQMSFGFTVAKGGEHAEQDGAVRIIDRVARLFDVSVVTFPAYPATSVQARMYMARLAAQMADPIDPLCENDDCGHPLSDHPGQMACVQGDGCEAFAAVEPSLQDEAVSLNVPRPEPVVSQRGKAVTPRLTAVSLSQLNRRLHRAEDFALAHGLRPRKEA